ncbi:MAG: phosphate butyryltransferase [Tissierellia bacterium]|nr:phosphate butyryltransferase [Tissierellia bacterium]
MVKDFSELYELALKKGPKKIAVAVAQDKDVLEAIKASYENGLIEPVLIGDKNAIEEIAKDIQFNLENIEIIDEKDITQAARIATELVSSGKASILMKGLVDTSIIMKAVLDHDIGLRTDSIISHVAVFEVPTYHKIFMITDAAMIIAPTLEQKKQIAENAISLAHSLGIEMPKVAVIAAKEKVSAKMEATVHAKELTNMNKRGEIRGALVEGPLALDNAISKESARIKGIDSVVAGDADILLMPDIEAGNVLYKALSFLANAESAGLIVGTKNPIVLTSRADSAEAKLNSIVLATLMAK